MNKWRAQRYSQGLSSKESPPRETDWFFGSKAGGYQPPAHIKMAAYQFEPKNQADRKNTA